MFERIIVPLDGGPVAEMSLAPARELARLFGAELVLTEAVTLTQPQAVAAGVDTTERERMHEVDAYLRHLADDLRAEGYSVGIALALGDPARGIASMAEMDEADLVVMTTHLRREPATWPRSPEETRSVTLGVLERVRAPLLVWRASQEPEAVWGSGVQPRPPLLATPDAPVLVPLDGSELAERALPWAEALGAAYRVPLLLVRATPASTGAARMANTYLQRIRDDIESRGVTTITSIQAEPAPEGIDAARSEYGASLIVMATHGAGAERTPRPGLVMGSVAGHLIAESDGPTLVIPMTQD